MKAKFTESEDYPIRLRRFLIRENALGKGVVPANPEAPSAIQLLEAKRRLAVKDLIAPFVKKSIVSNCRINYVCFQIWLSHPRLDVAVRRGRV